jgi:hypothetical protein
LGVKGRTITLVEVGGCIFDKQQLDLSHGFDDLDPVARETRVNHIHLDGDHRQAVADRFMRSWASEMLSRWPERTFRILGQTEPYEVIISFHTRRPGNRKSYGAAVEIIEIGARSTDVKNDH